MLKPQMSKFRSDLSVRLEDIAEKQVPAKLKPVVERPSRQQGLRHQPPDCRQLRLRSVRQSEVRPRTDRRRGRQSSHPPALPARLDRRTAQFCRWKAEAQPRPHSIRRGRGVRCCAVFLVIRFQLQCCFHSVFLMSYYYPFGYLMFSSDILRP